MYIYSRGAWRTGYLDESVRPGTSRVTIHRQIALIRSTDQFFERPRSVRLLWTYFRSLGPIEVMRKVRSRSREAIRNDVWLSIGIGRATINGEAGCAVQFILTSSPRAVERAVTSNLLLRRCDESVLRSEAAYFVAKGEMGEGARDEPFGHDILDLRGWQPESQESVAVPEASWDLALRLTLDPSGSQFVPLGLAPTASECQERAEVSEHRSTSRPIRSTPLGIESTYTCFGYGQYSKTQVLPNLSRHLTLANVHEINPLQIGRITQARKHGWDTSPEPREGERIHSASIASFHHTHATLAATLIVAGTRHVILEKPVAVDAGQLAAMLAAAVEHDARIHCAFQRRYSILTGYLRSDFGHDPISMACTVFEVPLPRGHWYRWPVSGGPVIANGCHWIDHFLFINDFSTVCYLDAYRLSDQYVLTLTLENGASAIISLRHSGSSRIGVREHCTFWNEGRTAVIEDMRRYSAEYNNRVIRKRSVHPYEGYKRMYRVIAEKVKADHPGDVLEHVEATGLAAILLAERADRLG